MTGSHYRIVDKGTPVGEGVAGGLRLSVSAIAKRNNGAVPYCIANEYISGKIGAFLGLPIPPVCLLSQTANPGAGASLVGSLDFNFTGDSLPPVTDSECVKLFPDLSTGLVLFDILVANSDRHDCNLSVDTLSTPPRMSVFDHSHTLLGTKRGKGVERLENLRGRLGISAGSTSQGNRHFLLDAVNDSTLFERWIGRINELPDFFIDDACDAVEGLGTDRLETEAIKKFLKERRDALRQILNTHKDEFTGIDFSDKES